MFIDEKTQTKIYADLDNTVIHATFRPQDLIPAFLDVIKDTVEYTQILQNNSLQFIFDSSTSDDERWESDEISFFLNEELFYILNSYAPDGYYFGSHEGNDSDFGFWEITED